MIYILCFNQKLSSYDYHYTATIARVRWLILTTVLPILSALTATWQHWLFMAFFNLKTIKNLYYAVYSIIHYLHMYPIIIRLVYASIAKIRQLVPYFQFYLFALTNNIFIHMFVHTKNFKYKLSSRAFFYRFYWMHNRSEAMIQSRRKTEKKSVKRQPVAKKLS